MCIRICAFHILCNLFDSLTNECIVGYVNNAVEGGEGGEGSSEGCLSMGQLFVM